MATRLHKLTPLGCAYPPEKYPDPIKVDRKILNAFIAADNAGVDFSDGEAVLRFLTEGGYKEATEFCNTSKLIAGDPSVITTKGIEIKRYRVTLLYADDTTLILQESEDWDQIRRYVEGYKAACRNRGYIIRPAEDKSVNILRAVVTEGGGTAEKHYCNCRVTVIKARNFTHYSEQRYPTPTDTTLQKEEEEASKS